MSMCGNCGGLIGEPGIAYGWGGKWCNCQVQPQIQRPIESGAAFSGIDGATNPNLNIENKMDGIWHVLIEILNILRSKQE